MRSLAVFLFSLALVGCGGGGSSGSDAPIGTANFPPVANVGVAQDVVTGTLVTLDGSASSDANGDPLTFAWTLTAIPNGSNANLSSANSAKPTFTADIAGAFAASLIVSDGKVNSNVATVTITAKKPVVLSQAIDRTATAWNISSSISTIDGKKTTNMFVGGASGGNFHIFCSSDGTKGYYITTDYITGSGYIRYRIGNNPVVTQSWSESQSAGFRLLTPPSFDITLLQKMYQNWDFKAEIDRYGVGIVNAGFSGISGFPAAIDKTRVDCGWSTTMFPPNNGWSKDFPDVPPVGAKEATYTAGAVNQFGLIAWRDLNSDGQQQLLVRLGENKSLCNGSILIDDTRLFVEQNGKQVSAVSGTKFQLSCQSDLPATFALQGDFDASKPFILRSFPFLSTVLSLGQPISSISFE